MNTSLFKVTEIVNQLLTENQSSSIFIKDSFPGKMHFQALLGTERDNLDFEPSKVYQVYLPFTLEGNLITKDTHMTGNGAMHYSEVTDFLKEQFNQKIFISKSRADERMNSIDRSQNKETSTYLNLDKIELWQGIMFYFFV